MNMQPTEIRITQVLGERSKKEGRVIIKSYANISLLKRKPIFLNKGVKIERLYKAA